MVNRSDDLEAAVREIAAQRDHLLRSPHAISAHRLQRLHSVLASEFPVEAALSLVAKRRDEMFADRAPRIRASLEAGFAEMLRTPTGFAFSVRRALALAATVILFAAGIALVSQWKPGGDRLEASGAPLMHASPDSVEKGGVAHRTNPARLADGFLLAPSNQLTLRSQQERACLAGAVAPDRGVSACAI